MALKTIQLEAVIIQIQETAERKELKAVVVGEIVEEDEEGKTLLIFK